MRLKKLLSVTIMMLVILLLGVSAYASCTSVMVGKDATVDGSVINSHLADGWFTPLINITPGQTYEKGTMMNVYDGRRRYFTRPGIEPYANKVGEIPQVEQTYTYFDIGFPFMNEHQISIGSMYCTSRKELISPKGIMMATNVLEKFALTRAKTAREAIQVMGDLSVKYGFNYGSSTVTVGDPNEVWEFEIAGGGTEWTPDSGKPGAVWAAQRIPDGEVGVNANRFRIGEIDLDDTDHFMASEDVFTLGEEMGYYDPKSGKPFLFYEVYGPKTSVYSSRREWRVLSLVAPSLNLDPNADRYPFSVKPDKKLSVQDIMAILRDHYEGTEFDMTQGMAAGPFGNPNRHSTPSQVKPEDRKDLGWGRAISTDRCSYSHVSQSRNWLPNPIGGLLWFGEDSPHSTCYIPLYSGITEVPKSFSSGKRAEFDRDTAWWAFNFVANWAQLKWSYMIEDIKVAQNEMEGDFFAMQPAIEMTAAELYKKDPSLAVKFLTDYSNNCANRSVDRWWKLADELIAKYDDGYLGDLESVGYPTWWLEEVDFGPGPTIIK